MIPYGRQEITQDDIDAVVEVLRSNFLTQGPKVPEFENAIAEYCGVRHAVAMNSATSSLHLACLALGLGPGDRLWTTPNTFVASANCARYCGAEVEFVDIDPHTFNMSIVALEQKLKKAKKSGAIPKVVLPVHLCGASCDMRSIRHLAAEYQFRIIEDAAHAIGGRYDGAPIGDCRYSDITVFSFHPVKIITTAEGGVACTNSVELAERMELLRSHGITRNPERMRRKSTEAWYYEQIELGFNYRMTDLQAALGLSQLKRLDSYVSRRHEIADRYYSQLAGLPIDLPKQYPSDICYSSLHLFPMLLKTDNLRVTRQTVFNSLRDNDIGVNVHYFPVHLQPYYQDMGFRVGDFPNSERFYERAISLPIFPALESEKQDIVIAAVKRALA